MSGDFSYYSSIAELGGRKEITVFSRARLNVLATQYAKSWLNENENVWKIRDTVRLDEKKEKYLLRSVRDDLLKLPEEGVWRVEAKNGKHYTSSVLPISQRKDNSNIAENKKAEIVPFPENEQAQQNLIEALMSSADS